MVMEERVMAGPSDRKGVISVYDILDEIFWWRGV